MTDEKKIQELEEAFKEEVVEVVPAPKPKPEVKRPPNAWPPA
jgi:hypothetical protein